MVGFFLVANLLMLSIQHQFTISYGVFIRRMYVLGNVVGLEGGRVFHKFAMCILLNHIYFQQLQKAKNH